ncbi:MAG: hypothetical protein PHV34_11810 [Verrucomicrobiae bacterium]|nr:hypothetical protein [Verrucomicrobiae bacterium]
MKMRRNCRGASLAEMAMVMAAAGILMASAAYGWHSHARLNRGLRTGAELQQVWLAQKAWVVRHLDDPAQMRLDRLSLAVLRSEGFLPATPLVAEELGTIDVTVMPPAFSMDGCDGDEKKTNRVTGDHLHDVGRE